MRQHKLRLEDGRELLEGGEHLVWAQFDTPVLGLTAYTAEALGICFLSDGKYLTSCSADRTARIWNAETGQLCQTLEGH